MTNASLASTNTGMKLNGRILLGSMCFTRINKVFYFPTSLLTGFRAQNKMQNLHKVSAFILKRTFKNILLSYYCKLYHTNPYLRKPGILLHFTSRERYPSIKLLYFLSEQKSFNIYTKLTNVNFINKQETSWIVFVGLSIKNSQFPILHIQ